MSKQDDASGITYGEAWEAVEALSRHTGRTPQIHLYPPYKSKLGVWHAATVWVAVDLSPLANKPACTHGQSRSFGTKGESRTLSAAIWTAASLLLNRLQDEEQAQAATARSQGRLI